MDIIRKLIKYFLKNTPTETMFTLTIFKILLFEGRSVLEPAQRVPGGERVNSKPLWRHDLKMQT